MPPKKNSTKRTPKPKEKVTNEAPNKSLAIGIFLNSSCLELVEHNGERETASIVPNSKKGKKNFFLNFPLFQPITSALHMLLSTQVMPFLLIRIQTQVLLQPCHIL